MENISIIKKDESLKKIENQLLDCLEYCEMVEIIDRQSMETATDNIGLIKRLLKSLDDKRIEICRPYADELKKFKVEVDKVINLGTESKIVLEKKYFDYMRKVQKAEQELREADQRRLIEAEKKAKEEAEANILAVAEKHNLPELIDQAIAVSAAADKKIAFLETKVIDPLKISSHGAMFSSSVRKTWTGEVIDKRQFLQFVLDSGRLELAEVNQPNLNNFAKNNGKEETREGMKLYQKESLTSR